MRDSITRASTEVLGIGFPPNHDGSWLMWVQRKRLGATPGRPTGSFQSGGLLTLGSLGQIDRAANLLGDGALENVETLIELTHRGRERHHALDHLVVRAGALDDQAVTIGPCGHGCGALRIGA